jgi:hypothetical protein
MTDADMFDLEDTIGVKKHLIEVANYVCRLVDDFKIY